MKFYSNADMCMPPDYEWTLSNPLTGVHKTIREGEAISLFDWLIGFPAIIGAFGACIRTIIDKTV